MSRRDTIIVAVLLNAAVLAVLFMLAVNTDEDKVSDQSEIAHEIVKSEEPAAPEPLEPIAMIKDPAQDEVDSVLNEYGTNSSADTIIPYEETSVSAEKTSEKETPATYSNDSETPKLSGDEKIVEVTVKKGDALERIARANGTTIDAIKKVNNLKTEKLKVGQVLKVPVSLVKKTSEQKKTASTAVAKTTTNISSLSGDPQYYTIKSGDNPWKIAKQFHVKMEDLLKLNSLNEEKARNLKVGDQIRVR